MKAPVGALVKITYDGFVDLGIGDVLCTDTGRCYVVVTGRRQQRGKHRGRHHLQCMVAAAPPPGARVFPLYWYSRDAKKHRD